MNRVKALDTLAELYNVYSKLIVRNVIVNKTKSKNDYTIMFDGSLSESLNGLIQPILDKHNLGLKKTKNSITIYSL